ncbi:MAG TPA: hypothetical protein IAB45_05280 [Candidatus Onthousia faecavium]|nr:hypothetical protein [Candidatus Onthousia faecavium]
MPKKINEIINQYNGDSTLYELLKNYYNDKALLESKPDDISEIKQLVANYYLSKYPYKDYYDNAVQDRFISKMTEYYTLKVKTRNINNKIKFYPVKISTEMAQNYYQKYIHLMVNEQLEKGLSIEELFSNWSNTFASATKEYKEYLLKADIYLYYGSPFYMIERSKFISNCISNIPNVEESTTDLLSTMDVFANTYMQNRNSFDEQADFPITDEQFYRDYDDIEACYIKFVELENKLAPIVLNYWQDYLTSPKQHDMYNYKYLTHSFGHGIIDYNLMTKACCSLSTNEIDNLMYGNCGLIYEPTPNSIDTMSTDDAGSWIINRKEFIEKGCPSTWQLTNLDGDSVFYEYPQNSKLIMPEIFAEECKEQSLNPDSWDYSEIFLNKNAKVVGAFYTNDCDDIDEIKNYAEIHDLPLAHIQAKEQIKSSGIKY